VDYIIALIQDVTARKHAEETERYLSTVLRTQQEASLDGIYVVDANQKIVSLNRRFVEMWGLSDEVVASASDERALEAVLRNFESPDAFMALVKDLYGNKDRELRDELHLKDGRTIDRYSMPMVGPDGDFMGRVFYFRDVTEQKRAEDTLRQSEERFRGYFEPGLVGMAVTLPDKGIAEVNSKFCELFGYTREELLRMDWAALTHPDDLAADVAQFNRILRGAIDSYVLEKRFIRKDGATVDCTISVSCVRRADDSVNYIVALVQDITERKHADETLRAALVSSVEAIAATLEMRDPYTAGHSRSVADLAAAIAREMGLPADSIEGIHFGALIHDLGKIQVPAEILSKPTRLTPLEFALIKVHPQAGYDIVKEIKFPWPVAEMVHQHHERLDGTGYPQGLKGDAIALEARIISVADVVETMASHRPYRAALGIDRALEEIQSKCGSWFEPAAVDACVRLFREKGFTIKKGTFG
jgi:PAS domain S-box-containing protein/putative nucleotidyltransferase with HDIG domain